MKCKRGGRINGEWVEQEDLTHDIEHNGQIIATIKDEDDVWQFYFREEHKLTDLREGWHYCSIGWGGLLMENRNTGEQRRWTTILRKDATDVP